MKQFKKLNKYLLENYPLLFQSKFFQLLFAGLGIWLISFLSGYVLTTKYSILRQNIDTQYINSSFVGFHIILVLIVVSLWVFKFFQLNPIKNYYPLTNQYFTKLFLLLLLPFVLLVSAYIPYTSGAILKTSQLINEKEFIKDAEALNLGATFFVTSLSDYGIDDKAYPAPFPVKFFNLNKNDGKWKNGDGNGSRNGYTTSVHYHPNVNKFDYLKPNDSIYSLEEYIAGNENIHTLNGRKYLFHNTVSKYWTNDSCTENEFINKVFDVSNIKNLSHRSLYNYSADMVNISFLKPFPYEKVHSIMDKKDMKSISKVMDDFKKVLNKYSVENSIKTKSILTYLENKKFNNLEINFLQTYSTKDYYYDNSFTETEVLSEKALYESIDYYENMDYSTEIKEYLKGKTALEKAIILERNYFLEKQLNNLEMNFIRVYQSGSSIFKGFVFYFFGAAFLVLFFIWFVFMDIRAWLISIPVAGVVFIIIALIFVGLDKFNILDNNNFGILALLIMYVILFFNWRYIKSATKSKMISSILMNISYVLSIGILPFTILMINDKTKYQNTTIDKCGKSSIEYHDFSPFVEDPVVVFMLSIIGVVLFFHLIKKWKAKRD